MDINTGSPSGKLIFHIFAGLAEFERNLIRERTKAGLDAARARGEVGGRPPKIKPKQLDAIREQFKSGKYSAIEIADMHGIHRSSVYRLLDENGVGDSPQ